MSGPWSKRLRAKRGRGIFPVGTISFYGPDDGQATKVVASIVASPGALPESLMRWFAQDLDVRLDPRIGAEVLAFLSNGGARSIVKREGIWGCPHEEGTDYPEGGVCPECPFWANRDRDTGKLLPQA